MTDLRTVDPAVARQVYDEAQRGVCTCPDGAQNPACPTHPDVTMLIAIVRTYEADMAQMMNAPGVPGREHTSQVAAVARPPSELRFGKARWRVLNELTKWPGGATAADIADALTDAPHPVSRNQIATRLGELRAAGWVEYVTEGGARVTKPTSFHADGSVLSSGYLQRITLSGYTALRTVKR